MKIFISSDIEGVCGIASWDEAQKNHTDYAKLAQEMTQETKSACNGAIKAKAKEIWVKDGHGTGRNIDINKLPQQARLIRGWSGSPLSMMQELDESFDAAMMIGYHSKAGSETNPLAHTKTKALSQVVINDQIASEFLINSYCATYFKVPVIFISGDQGICQEAKQINPQISTVETFEGLGGSAICLHPDLVNQRIEQQVEKALKQDFKQCLLKMPENFTMRINFTDHQKAFKAAYYPGMEKISSHEVEFKTQDFFEILKALVFVVY